MSTLNTFLSSSWFAEESASPMVERLLARTTDVHERRVLQAYAAEEDEHARLIGAYFEKHGLERGPPFWIQPALDRIDGRTPLLVLMFHMELMAALFYGTVAQSVEAGEARALIRRLLRDEARHIRLFRSLARRELQAKRGFERVTARALVTSVQVSAYTTAQYQARQLAPLLGERAAKLPRRVWAQFTAERGGLFDAAPQKLDGWWAAQKRGQAVFLRSGASGVPGCAET
ncbi:MAG: hypothetical protein JNK82_21420 [Myxococcaceae bacterium]|nr:hypothetical protein [Myxococcaceae bacterium]